MAAPRSRRSTRSRACGSVPTPASRTSRTATGRSRGGRSSRSACGWSRSCATTGFRLPIIANGGIRDFDDCREYFWAGADAVSLGSAVWLRPMPLYALGPVEGLRIRRLITRVARFTPPAAAPHWQPATRPDPRRRRALATPPAREPSPRRGHHDRRHHRLRRGGPAGPRRLPRDRRAPGAGRAAGGRSRAELATIADVTEVPFRRLRAHAITDDDLAELVDLVRRHPRRRRG